jgi:hypothetical protein
MTSLPSLLASPYVPILGMALIAGSILSWVTEVTRLYKQIRSSFVGTEILLLIFLILVISVTYTIRFAWARLAFFGLALVYRILVSAIAVLTILSVSYIASKMFIYDHPEPPDFLSE